MHWFKILVGRMVPLVQIAIIPMLPWSSNALLHITQPSGDAGSGLSEGITNSRDAAINASTSVVTVTTTKIVSIAAIDDVSSVYLSKPVVQDGLQSTTAHLPRADPSVIGWSAMTAYNKVPANRGNPVSIWSEPPIINPNTIAKSINVLTTTSTAAQSPKDVIDPATNIRGCVRYNISDCVPCRGQPGSNPDNYCGLTSKTNYYHDWPETCRRIRCHLYLETTKIAPDGIPRLSTVFNQQLPGPLIEASWGDEMEVIVTNDAEHDGTTIHFHGVRQYGTNAMDGVPSVTQCPLPGNGSSLAYRFTLTQYGTTWYHSHFGLQAWDGAFGPLIIHGPNHVPYDIDVGPVVLQDWLHTPASSMFPSVERTGAPIQDSLLINGQGTWTNPSIHRTTGSHATFTFTPGKTHRLRLINAALDSYLAFSIDSHTLTVIAADLVPVQPFNATVLNIAIGQRYDVLVHADQLPSTYALRADPLSANSPGLPPCAAPNTMSGLSYALIHYTSPILPLPFHPHPWPHPSTCDAPPLRPGPYNPHRPRPPSVPPHRNRAPRPRHRRRVHMGAEYTRLPRLPLTPNPPLTVHQHLAIPQRVRDPPRRRTMGVPRDPEPGAAAAPGAPARARLSGARVRHGRVRRGQHAAAHAQSRAPRHRPAARRRLRRHRVPRGQPGRVAAALSCGMARQHGLRAAAACRRGRGKARAERGLRRGSRGGLHGVGGFCGGRGRGGRDLGEKHKAK